MSGGRIPDGLQLWIDARKRHRLSHAQVQMARELGMNPKKPVVSGLPTLQSTSP